MTDTLISGVIALILSLLYRIFLALSISLDAKEKRIKARTSYTVLTFFFPLITGIVYACSRKAARRLPEPELQTATDPQPQKNSKASIICLIIAVVMFIGGTISSNYFSTAYFLNISDSLEDWAFSEGYDMLGNKIDENGYPALYDREGNRYFMVEDEEAFSGDGYYVNESTRQKYDAMRCYVDSDGYFYYDANDELLIDNDFYTYYDDNGNTYYSAYDVYWDADGNLKSNLSDFINVLKPDETKNSLE